MFLEFTGGNTHRWAVSFNNYMKTKMENDNKINRRLCKQ